MSFSYTEVLRDNILLDLSSDRTAVSLSTAVSDYEVPLFASSADVPLYLYTPIWELLGLSSSAELDEAVISNNGERKIPSSPCIIIESDYQLTSPFAPQTSMRADNLGARYAKCFIKVQNVKTNYSVNMVEQVSLRLEWLLDFYARVEHDASPDIIVTGAKGILSPQSSGGSIFRARYLSSGKATASDWTHEYCVEFTRIFS